MSECETNGCKKPDTQTASLFRHPLVQALLDQLPKPSLRTEFKLEFPIAKSFTDKGRFIVAGYASVEVIDSQNEMIPIPVLKEAWEHFRKNEDFKIGSLMHSNVPVAKILDEFTDSKGQVWKSGVDDTGLFIVAEIRDDIEMAKKTRQLITDQRLTGFSIGGEALASSVVCEGKCYTKIEKMELHEIAIVDKPANAPSVFTIVKSDRLRKLAELIDVLPNLIISPGIAKLGGSVAELGEGHDFDVIINVTKGSFVDRAIQTRIYNELRKADKLDLWNDIQIIHEPEGMGPFTDYIDLYDLVLLRSSPEKKNMVIKSEDKIKKDMTESEIRNKIVDLEKERRRISDMLWPSPPKSKIVDEAEISKYNFELTLLNAEIDAYTEVLAETLIKKGEKVLMDSVVRLDHALLKVENKEDPTYLILSPSIKKIDEAISLLSFKGKLNT